MTYGIKNMNDIRFPDQLQQVFSKIDSSEIPEGVSVLNAPLTWQYTKGENIVVAVIDTGVDLNHPDLKDNIIEAISLLPGEPNPQDYHGHGTHVAGAIAGIENGFGVVGVAPKAKILSIKVFPASGQGNNLPIPEAVEFATKWTGKNGEKVRIINMSLTTNNTPKLYSAICKAVDSGISVVCASGNDGDGKPDTEERYFPGYYQEVIEVGAYDIRGNMADFSNSNNQLDVVASGVNVKSCYLNGQYATWNGTSMATPHIAGICALLIAGLEKSSKRRLSEPEVFYNLIKRTRDLGLDPRWQGYGMPDMSLYLNEFVSGIALMPPQPEVYVIITGGVQVYATESLSEAKEQLQYIVVNSAWNIIGHVERISDRAIVYSLKLSDKKIVDPKMSLTGKAIATAEQMELEIRRVVEDRVGYFANLYLQEGEMEGVRGDLAFAQSAVLTLFFLFKEPNYSAGKFNFGMLHGKNNTPKDVSFPDERIGIRAHIQHFKAGANKEPLNNPLVDPYFNDVVRGSKPTLESLSTASLADRYEKILNTFVPDGYIAPNPFPKPIEEGEDVINTLIIYFGEADRKWAEGLRDFVGGYSVSEADYKANPIKFVKCYKVGGTAWKPEGNVIMLAGANKYETAKKMLQEVTK